MPFRSMILYANHIFGYVIISMIIDYQLAGV